MGRSRPGRGTFSPVPAYCAGPDQIVDLGYAPRAHHIKPDMLLLRSYCSPFDRCSLSPTTTTDKSFLNDPWP